MNRSPITTAHGTYESVAAHYFGALSFCQAIKTLHFCYCGIRIFSKDFLPVGKIADLSSISFEIMFGNILHQQAHI